MLGHSLAVTISSILSGALLGWLCITVYAPALPLGMLKLTDKPSLYCLSFITPDMLLITETSSDI